MAGEAEQKSWREITADFDDDERALRGLVTSLDEVDEEAVKDLHPVRYDKTPSHAPGWAKRNWWASEKALKKAGAKDSIVRLVAHAKINDLLSLVECLRRAPGARAAWESWHPSWVAAEVARLERDHGAGSKRDPGSGRSILASLTDRQRHTWQSFRKHSTRLSRGTGQRQRNPSKQRLAIRAWEGTRADDAKLLRGLIVDKERIALLAQQAGLANGAFLERLRLALDSLQDAIEARNRPNGPQASPQEIRKRRAKPPPVSLIQ